MEFKYAFSLLFSNMGQTMKILAWMIITWIITIGVGCAIFIPLWNEFASTTDFLCYVSQIKEYVKECIEGNITIIGTAHGVIYNIQDAFAAMSYNKGATVGATIGFVFLYGLFQFINSLAFYPIADMINKKMSSNMSFGFASNFVLNLKTSIKYAGARLSMTLPLDIICVIITSCIVFGLFPYIKFIALTIALLYVILYISLRITCFAGWIPRMLYYPEEKVFVNFGRSLTSVKHNFISLFKAFLITCSVVYLAVVVFGTPTFGLLGIILPCTYYYLIRAVELVGYYKMNGMSFYMDSNTVIDTVEFGYRNKVQGE